jgi:hypothetical protein
MRAKPSILCVLLAAEAPGARWSSWPSKPLILAFAARMVGSTPTRFRHTLSEIGRSLLALTFHFDTRSIHVSWDAGGFLTPAPWCAILSPAQPTPRIDFSITPGRCSACAVNLWWR